MKTSSWAATVLSVASTVSAFGNIHNNRLVGRKSSSDDDEFPDMVYVPAFNFSMPVDHFNSSDSRVFNQRYWVNDAFYQPGGPVILYDFGEAGVDNVTAAMMLAGYANTTSAPLELAKELHGLVIGWEHRYYGYTVPVPLNTTDSSSDSSSSSGSSFASVYYEGVPEDGVAGYKYLTVEQALEDAAHFARHFNQTKLGVNNTVLRGDNATQGLGPFHTPWIFVGGSYPGNRAAWARLRNPDVFYAAWASSAPVQTQIDGSAYYNSVYRGLPKNCTADIQSAARYIEDIMSGNDKDVQRMLQTSAVFAIDNYVSSRSTSYQNYDGEGLTDQLFRNSYVYVQSYGISATTQLLCDAMESFNVDQFTSNVSVASTNITTAASVFFYNNGKGKPSDKGIFASNADTSGRSSSQTSRQIGLAAFLYGVKQYNVAIERLIGTGSGSGRQAIAPYLDLHSWEWQVVSEVGLLPSFNASSKYNLGTKFLGPKEARSQVAELFPSIPKSDFPEKPNQTFSDSVKGWLMQPSNTMWTNGEFDPWRAFGVMSLETELGAPKRDVKQDVPPCGQPPSNLDVFGLLYKGAAHAEDMGMLADDTQGFSNAKPPVTQGVELFSRAYKEWVTCFNKTRLQGDNGGNGGSNGNNGTSDNKNAAGGRTAPGAAGVWGVAAVWAVLVAYYIL